MTDQSTPAAPWRRNLYIIFFIEFMVMMAFSFTSPFMPLLIQQLGSFSEKEAAFWSGISSSSSAMTMCMTAPLWGMLADRYGRRPMLLRAMFGVTVSAALIGLSPNIWWLLGLRTAQGLFSGSLAAAIPMVASTTPKEKIPYAMGILNVAMYGSSAFGPLIGGVLASTFGYQACFYIISVVYFIGGVAVLLFTTENFIPVTRGQGRSLGTLWRVASSRHVAPLLLVTCVLYTGGASIMYPIIPLIIKNVDATVDPVVTSGLVMSLMGVVSTVSSLTASQLGRLNLKKMLVFSCIGTGFLSLPPAFATTAILFAIFVALRGALNGGLMVSSNSLVSLSVTESEQGTAYGLQQSASSLGNTLGPLIGAGLASLFNLTAIFPAAALFFVFSGFVVLKLLPDVKSRAIPTERIMGNEVKV